ncbi:hypothetical protein ACHAW5_005597 [Stephanodiscus triporus]|uniref:Nuclear speckle splicing regulatory protein 1 N-terminal domain-containing protein n=1 Tax=Stephanodiscus triporus TaxID=2934178 RepID=A0ABD3R160_9STRA
MDGSTTMNGRGNLAYGLNSRNNKRKKGGPINFLGSDDSDDSNGDGGGGGGRGAVNREIAAEQAALRRRAEAAAKGAVACDYDAEYDSFSSSGREEKEEDDGGGYDDAAIVPTTTTTTAAAGGGGGGATRAKPRYIAGLLRTAERRNREHEVLHERKVIGEQASDVDPAYEGKETFVTSSYKRKMEERERWAKEEEERTRREEEYDAKLRERRGGLAMGSLMLGVVGRNLLMEGGGGGGSDRDRDRGGGGGADENLADRQLAGERYEKEDRRGADEWDENPRADRGGNTDRGGTPTTADDADAPSDRDDDRRIREGRGSCRTAEPGPARRCRPPSSSSARAGGGGNDAASAFASDLTTTTTTTTTRGMDDDAKGEESRRRILEERATKIRDARKRYFERRGRGTATATTS